MRAFPHRWPFLLAGIVPLLTVPACQKLGEPRAKMAGAVAARVAASLPAQNPPAPSHTEEYATRTDNAFHLAEREPLSTFSIDVDTASYSNVRRFLREGKLPPKDAVRVEELLNYFNYNYPQPEADHPIAINAEAGACPWNAQHLLVRIGLQGKTLTAEQMPPRNFVFLVDTSGSMNASNRLPLLKQALHLLAKQLTARDRVAIVSYAGYAALVLPSTRGDQHATIAAAINSLHAAGSTNGGEGIVLAYRIAQENFLEGGANRVILGTDGDFNVGVTGAELIRLVEKKRDTGVFLTVLGFGMGNLKDATMEKLAQVGNGQYAYIDTFAEAQRVFVEQVAGLVPIARDVKVQVEFNPAQVQAYLLIGYENRLLNHQDFRDHTKDAGDMGAGNAVTVLYELVPPGVPIEIPKIDPLKYQQKPKVAPAAGSRDLLTVKVRYLPPEGKVGRDIDGVVAGPGANAGETSDNFRFAAAVASFGMLLRDSPYKGQMDHAGVQALARTALEPDPNGYRQEFLQLVGIAERLAGPPAANGRKD
jgi:Ca-activated chloride channel family protein